jgi:hypothetical protein
MQITGIGLIAAVFTACEIDNYEAPNGGLYGQIIDSETGGPVPQPAPSDWGLRLRFYETDRDNAVEQHFYAQTDGSFKNSRLFNGAIRLVLEQRNFFPVDTLNLNIQGQTKKDIEVAPYARIRIENLKQTEELVTVDFTLSRSKNRSYVRHRITQYCLLWHVSPAIDNQAVNFSGRVSTGISDESGALNRLQSIALDLSTGANQKLLKEKANIIQGNGNVIYIRLCVVTEDEGEEAFYTNYSAVYPVVIPLNL